jgi:hypothetical protein
MGRFLPVCFYQKPTISRQSAFGEMQEAAKCLELGGKRTFSPRRIKSLLTTAKKSFRQSRKPYPIALQAAQGEFALRLPHMLSSRLDLCLIRQA